jgi:hypothetical protein
MSLSCPGRGAAPFTLLRRSRDPLMALSSQLGPGSAAHRLRAVLRPGHDSGASPQQLIEPVAQLVLVIGFCQSRQIELGAFGQFGIAGREQDRQ